MPRAPPHRYGNARILTRPRPPVRTPATPLPPPPLLPRLHGTRPHLAHLRFPVPHRRRAGCAHCQGAGPGRHHWLPGGGHRHRALGPGAGQQRAGHPALCRVWRGAHALPGRAGAATQPPVGAAPPHLRHRHGPGAGLRSGALCTGRAGRPTLAREPGGRTGPGAVVHGDCAAGAGRAQPDAHQQRPGRFFDPAVPGRGRHPHPGPAARAGRRRWRRRGPHAGRDGAGGAEDRRRDRRHHPRRAPAAAPRAALDRQEQHPRNLHRRRAAAGGGHCLPDGAGGPVDGAGRLPRRCAAGRQRIPPRAGG
ncbi:hypothetical protein D3C71_1001490 [compost metagenome]